MQMYESPEHFDPRDDADFAEWADETGGTWEQYKAAMARPVEATITTKRGSTIKVRLAADYQIRDERFGRVLSDSTGYRMLLNGEQVSFSQTAAPLPERRPVRLELARDRARDAKPVFGWAEA